MTTLNKKDNIEHFSTKLSSGWIAVIAIVAVIFVAVIAFILSPSSGSSHSPRWVRGGGSIYKKSNLRFVFIPLMIGAIMAALYYGVMKKQLHKDK